MNILADKCALEELVNSASLFPAEVNEAVNAELTLAAAMRSNERCWIHLEFNDISEAVFMHKLKQIAVSLKDNPHKKKEISGILDMAQFMSPQDEFKELIFEYNRGNALIKSDAYNKYIKVCKDEHFLQIFDRWLIISKNSKHDILLIHGKHLNDVKIIADWVNKSKNSIDYLEIFYKEAKIWYIKINWLFKETASAIINKRFDKDSFISIKNEKLQINCIPSNKYNNSDDDYDAEYTKMYIGDSCDSEYSTFRILSKSLDQVERATTKCKELV